jgi:hypothetical protein
MSVSRVRLDLDPNYWIMALKNYEIPVSFETPVKQRENT